ncbi:related to glycinamide ribonucleotide transformylase [Melanopsichium pennsylvanicum]|uniref:phosphoribosylglycinamide formyltransferase 1 n=2 Tax=Melanopsichium pennsylvanicum TaxID=63383 RepID=A0AAJ5C2U9_9BASI|nr:related to glycinamide ribonucleotide transformylase [Melanopsichium pennsylvanicum 4]SNX81794.1 related to glycinamide ribonucleotide transformylase [Melanopsichium pennsylvanicum]
MSFSHHQPSHPFSRQLGQGEISHASSALGQPTQDLASWVDQIRQRNLSPASSCLTQGALRSPDDAAASPASELELEFQRQRLERQQRRDRLSVSGIRGISASDPNSPLATPSLEDHPSASFETSMAPPDASQSPSASPLLGSSPTKASGVTGIKRANSLLARYGGQYGPTGTAAGPKEPITSPVSLASFMGGRAAGPRLGRLAGDGKSAPPEADLIHESRRVPMPGMVVNSGRSLASFLEERADASGNRRSGGASPASPVAMSPGKASSPAKYSFTSSELGRPSNTVGNGSFALPAAPSSPKKAYLDLIEKQNAPQTSAPPSPVIPRASSPSKFHKFTGAESVTSSPRLERPASPAKGVGTSPLLDVSATAARNDNVFRSSRPLPVPNAQSHSYSSSHSPERKDAATSPLKPEDMVAPSAVAAAHAQTKPDTGLGKGWSQAADQDDDAPSQATSRSTSFANSELSGADRLPTASLSRLSAKKMVGQRIKEARMRDVVAQKEVETMQGGTTGRSLPSSPAAVRDRWPPALQTNASPVRSSFDQARAGSPWSPNKYGNALPGLAGRSPTKETSSMPWQSSSPKKTETVAEPRAEPIRLPGMGASVSPFARFAENRSRTEDNIVNPDTACSANETDQVLTSLTRARAKGPVRKAATVDTKPALASANTLAQGSSAPISAQVQQAESLQEAKSTPCKPPRRTTGKRIHVLVSGSGSNLQSLIDATLLNPSPGLPVIENAQITFVLSNRKAAYGLTRAAESNPPIPTKVLALKTWQNRNPGGTREEYDRVLARAVLDGPSPEGTGTPPDLIVLAGFMHIVSEPFLHALGHKTSLPDNTPTLGQRPSKAVPIINLHPALPKAFDGANAIPRAFEAYKQGLTDKTGCMVHEVVADVDRGRPIIVREVPILPSYDLEALEQAIHKVEHVIIVQAADLVLKGHLDEMIRQNAAAEKQRGTVAAAAAKKASPMDVLQLQSHHGDVADTASAIVRDARTTLSKYVSVSDVPAVSVDFSPSSAVSVEILAIDIDGYIEPLELSGDQTYQRGEQLRREQILHDDETLAVIKRFKSEAGLVKTKLWIRTGRSAALHPFELGPLSTSCAEGRKVAELAERYSVKPVVIPSGCESSELIAALSGTWAVSRQGSRKRFNDAATSLYRVRRALAPVKDAEERFAIQQVDLRTANLCSGDSFVFSVLSTLGVWHGRGSAAAVRAAAVRFAQALAKSGSSSVRYVQNIAEVEEGSEDSLFWNVFDKTEAYANAWSHCHGNLTNSDEACILDVELQDQNLHLTPFGMKGYYGAHDLLLPTHSNKISILNLRDRDFYVLVGKDARGDRLKLACAIRAAEELALQLQTRLRSDFASLSTIVPRPAVHVLILPSKIPSEVRAASRVWSDEVVGYLQSDSASRMNVCSAAVALEQLAKRSWSRWELQDLDHLPVGVDADDAKKALA